MKTKEKVNPKTPLRFSNGGDVANWFDWAQALVNAINPAVQTT
jgi:hypothetical protein